MNDYAISDDMFHQRALEEAGCVITAFGSSLATAMNSDREKVLLNKEQHRFIQGKVQTTIPVGEPSFSGSPLGSRKQ